MAKPRVRAKSAPKLGGTDANFVILGAIKNLVRWATANGVENSSRRRDRSTRWLRAAC
jgi:hypothetical protein